MALAMCDNIRGQTDMQADRQTDMQAGGQAGRQTDRQADIHKTHRHAGIVLSGVSCYTAPRDLVTHRIT